MLNMMPDKPSTIGDLLTMVERDRLISLMAYTAAKTAQNWHGDEWSTIIEKLRVLKSNAK